MALIAACEKNCKWRSARLHCVDRLLREIPLRKLLEVFPQELICSLTDWSIRHHHVKGVKRAVEDLELDRNIGPTKVVNVDLRFIAKWLCTADVGDRWRPFRIVRAACWSCVRRNVRHAFEITGPCQPVSP